MRFIALVLGLVIAAAPASFTAEVTLRLLDGTSMEVGALSLTGEGGLTVRSGAASETIALDDVLGATVAAADELPEVEDDTSVLLVGGTRLVGALLDGPVDELHLRTATLGDVKLPIDLILAVTFGPAGGRLDPASLGDRQGEDDVVFRRGPVEGDVVAGTVTRVAAEGVEIDSDLGVLTLDVGDVLGLSIAAFEDEFEPPERRVDVELRDGGLLVGDLLELSSGRLRVAGPWEEVLAVDLSRVAALRFGSSRFAWLSDLPPAEVEETPYLGGSDDFLFPWRRDRTVTGRALEVGGVRFGKGLGLHSRTRLTWNLDGAYARLDARVGVADEVLEYGVTGSIVVRVLVDGELRFETEALSAGKPAIPLAIDLTDAEMLRLEVDFGGRGDVGDRAVVGDPVLVLVRD